MLKIQLLAYNCPVNFNGMMWDTFGTDRQSASSVEKDANRALAQAHCCGVRNKLRFTSLRINSIVLTKKAEI
ncbi:hypothetical protein EVAR_9417_1 [Eumeta japonica]|uniref:Uncharacterized protein n=1 Tax=Eumeta variegata TaxID=151549 RepID=A0A4C1UD91_EUMVA|nr:hypothetical protein EVAR_9417_1 [Eumeta japonica]